jgi:hypothetical protein
MLSAESRLSVGNSETKQFRLDIEGLRAVAVFAVVAFHFGLPGIRGGFVGVDVFFVISGYLITSLLVRELEESGGIDLMRFYGRRARRLLPAVLLMTIAILVAVPFVFPPHRQLRLAKAAAATSLYVSNVLFLQQAQSYFAKRVEPVPTYMVFGGGRAVLPGLACVTSSDIPSRTSSSAPGGYASRRDPALIRTLRMAYPLQPAVGLLCVARTSLGIRHRRIGGAGLGDELGAPMEATADAGMGGRGSASPVVRFDHGGIKLPRIYRAAAGGRYGLRAGVRSGSKRARSCRDFARGAVSVDRPTFLFDLPLALADSGLGSSDLSINVASTVSGTVRGRRSYLRRTHLDLRGAELPVAGGSDTK